MEGFLTGEVLACFGAAIAAGLAGIGSAVGVGIAGQAGGVSTVCLSPSSLWLRSVS